MAAEAPKRKPEIELNVRSLKKPKNNQKKYTEEEYQQVIAEQLKAIDEEAKSYVMVPYQQSVEKAAACCKRLNITTQSDPKGMNVITGRNMFTLDKLNEQLKGRLVDGKHDDADKVECLVERMHIHLQIVFYSMIQGQSQIIDLIMLYALEFGIFSGGLKDDDIGVYRVPHEPCLLDVMRDVTLCRAFHPIDPMSDRTEISFSIDEKKTAIESIEVNRDSELSHLRLAIMVEIPPVGKHTGLWIDGDRTSVSWYNDGENTCIRVIDIEDEDADDVDVFDNTEDRWKQGYPCRVPRARERATGKLCMKYTRSQAYITSGHLTFYAREQ